MRYIVLAIFVYCLYLFLKFLLKQYLNSINRKKPKTGTGRFRSKKIDINKIEEADYEEIKTPKDQK